MSTYLPAIDQHNLVKTLAGGLASDPFTCAAPWSDRRTGANSSYAMIELQIFLCVRSQGRESCITETSNIFYSDEQNDACIQILKYGEHGQ